MRPLSPSSADEGPRILNTPGMATAVRSLVLLVSSLVSAVRREPEGRVSIWLCPFVITASPHCDLNFSEPSRRPEPCLSAMRASKPASNRRAASAKLSTSNAPFVLLSLSMSKKSRKADRDHGKNNRKHGRPAHV